MHPGLKLSRHTQEDRRRDSGGAVGEGINGGNHANAMAEEHKIRVHCFQEGNGLAQVSD
ncbi:MAG: hypothetical protein RBG13Loki_1729 [Promethearchaeota archaeon CR_4]|nr:MAG: hypothetical protein RBG13Loki_1729 [Candidatus Lokiarchaeota archaeon CR_4]